MLSALGVSERQRIEEVAERIVLLSDGAGQDVIDGFKDDIFDDAAREAFAAIPNTGRIASAIPGATQRHSAMTACMSTWRRMTSLTAIDTGAPRLFDGSSSRPQRSQSSVSDRQQS